MAPLTHIPSLPPSLGLSSSFHPLVSPAPKSRLLPPHSIKHSLKKLCFLLSLFIIHCCFLSPCSFYLRHFGRIPKFPTLSLYLAPFLPSSLSVIICTICPVHHSLLYPPLFSIWAPAQILQTLLPTGWGPNQQGDKSIQQENYVTCHHIDQPSAPTLGGFLLCPLLSVIGSPCFASPWLPCGLILEQ